MFGFLSSLKINQQFIHEGPTMTEALSKRTLYLGLEGGAVYTQEDDNQFLVIINQAALYDLLDEDEGMQIDCADKILSFSTLAERDLYLEQRFGFF